MSGTESRDRALRAIAALRKPDSSMARVPNTIRQSIADVIEEMLGEWKPIETAPKDGTKIILAKYGYVKGGSFAEWPKEGDPQIWTLWWVVQGFWSEKWNNWNDGIEPAGLAGPTHWRPRFVPPAPTEQRAAE